MERTDLEFIAWRIAGLRRVAVGAAAIGTMSLALSTVAIAMLAKAGGDSKRPNAVNATKGRDFSATFASAAAAIHTAQPKLEDRKRLYVEMLGKGEPVARTWWHVDATVAFAANLDAEAREEWVRRCLEMAKRLVVDDQARLSLRTTYPGVDLPSDGESLAMETLEVVYNLSETPTIRADAKMLFDGIAGKKWRLASAIHNDITPGYRSISPPPVQEEILDWRKRGRYHKVPSGFGQPWEDAK